MVFLVASEAAAQTKDSILPESPATLLPGGEPGQASGETCLTSQLGRPSAQKVIISRLMQRLIHFFDVFDIFRMCGPELSQFLHSLGP